MWRLIRSARVTPDPVGNFNRAAVFLQAGLLLSLKVDSLRGNMKLKSEKKSYFSVSFVVLSLSGLVMVLGCAYYGFKISGTGGALFGALIGLTIYGC
jgi:hypothetical protein